MHIYIYICNEVVCRSGAGGGRERDPAMARCGNAWQNYIYIYICMFVYMYYKYTYIYIYIYIYVATCGTCRHSLPQFATRCHILPTFSHDMYFLELQ